MLGTSLEPKLAQPELDITGRIYRVGQKSKLLILSEYVIKTEKMGEM